MGVLTHRRHISLSLLNASRPGFFGTLRIERDRMRHNLYTDAARNGLGVVSEIRWEFLQINTTGLYALSGRVRTRPLEPFNG